MVSKPLFQALSEDADAIAKALRKSDSGLVEVKFCLHTVAVFYLFYYMATIVCML